MKKNLSQLHCSYLLRLGITFFVSILCVFANAQSDFEMTADTLPNTIIDTSFVNFVADSLAEIEQDSLPSDTILKKISPDAIEHIVTYTAVDSIVIDVKNRKAYLFKTAVVYYEDMELHADYIEIDFKNNELYASGIETLEGLIEGSPYFIQDGTTYWANEIKYNFTTKKGKITSVITTEGEGFIHGKYVKKMEDYSFIKTGKYTTCELDHPHFEIAFTKAKIIHKKDDKKIITGPAYLSFVGIPTFLAIPFGFFPNESGRSSGFVMPTFGESSNRGFYFENFGYYFGISDNIDLLISGDIYTRGSWAVKARSNYIFRYKCNGEIEMSFAQNAMGERYTPTFRKANDFKIKWKHNQDPKFHPTTRFSAHVNIVSNTFNKYNLSNVNDYLSNQFNSSINFSTNIRSFFYLDASLSYMQNTQNHVVNLSFPEVNMSVNQFYPFRKKGKTGQLKWYDNISLKWSSQFGSNINSYDSLLLNPNTWQQVNVGMRHTIPLNIPIKIAKLINWNSSINFTERWYLQNIEKEFISYIDSSGWRYGDAENIFVRKFNALHELNLSSSLTTKVYFMYQFKKGKLKAIRHVMTPNLNFSYMPKINGVMTGTYFNSITGRIMEYSYYEGSMYGTANAKTVANLRLSIGNNVEMKVASKKDSITGNKKIVLLEDFSASMYYNFAADSMNWSMLSLTGRTTIFRQLYITFNLEFDPYSRDSLGNRTKYTEWKVNKKLLRFSSSGISLGFNWHFDKNTFSGKKKSENQTEEENRRKSDALSENKLGIPNNRPDYDNPWSVTLNYTFNYNTRENMLYFKRLAEKKYVDEKKYENNMVHTVNITGDVSITKKWKIGFSSGYDIVNKELTYTSIDIYRDLHCWEMRFNWIPLGFQKGWRFTINVKAAVLQSIKLNMKRDFRDNL